MTLQTTEVLSVTAETVVLEGKAGTKTSKFASEMEQIELTMC